MLLLHGELCVGLRRSPKGSVSVERTDWHRHSRHRAVPGQHGPSVRVAFSPKSSSLRSACSLESMVLLKKLRFEIDFPAL